LDISDILRSAMSQTIGYTALVVRDYDEAITFYTEKLVFTLVGDTHVAMLSVKFRSDSSKGKQ
jgi:catechol 2,3-dioxygenase-like lactoylglutathione lyase family enzyme